MSPPVDGGCWALAGPPHFLEDQASLLRRRSFISVLFSGNNPILSTPAISNASAASPLSPLAVTSQSPAPDGNTLNISQPLSQLHSHGVQHPKDEAYGIPAAPSPPPLLPPRSPLLHHSTHGPCQLPLRFFFFFQFSVEPGLPQSLDLRMLCGLVVS